MPQNLTFIHLSDIQFGRSNRYRGEKPYEQFYDRLADDLDQLKEKHSLEPTAVVITGDVGQESSKEEYEQAAQFLEKLLTKLRIGKERVVIVPGNHDVNRKLCEGARSTAQGYQEEFLPPYFEKFRLYQKFYNDFFDDIPTVRFDEEKLFQLYHFREEGILFAGLNSCIMESELDEDHYGHIGLEQVRVMATRCDELDPDHKCLRIVAMHHNFLAASDLDNENLRDANAIRPSLLAGGFYLILHGHRHEAACEQIKPGGAPVPLTVLATGSAGLDSDALPDHPNQYQVVKIENGNELTMYMRQYSAKTFGLSGKGKWVPDASLVAEGIVKEKLGLTQPRPRERKRASRPPSKQKARDRFRKHLIEDNRYLALRGFGTEVRAPVELEPVYISLRAVPRHEEGLEHGSEAARARAFEELEIGPALEHCEEQGYRGLVILGDPGSGKSTLLKFITLCLAEKRPKKETGIRTGRFPVLLPLRLVKSFEVSLAEALQAVYAGPALNLPQGFFEDLLDDEKCLIMLDGLDEVASQTRRKEALRWIEDERKARKDNLLLVTSRFAGYRKEDRLPGHYLELHVQDFSEDDIRQFARLWYREVETKQRGDTEQWREEARRLSDNLIAQVDEKQSLKDLARNPLMLQILCLVHRSRGAMPEQRTELYEECIQVLLEKWDEAKGIEVYLSAKQARRVLRPFARWLHSEEGRTHAGEEDVKRILLPELEKLKLKVTEDLDEHLERILFSVRDRSGLFVGYDVARYGFQHLSFQEFLAAEEVVKRKEVDTLIGHFGANWWREVVLLAMGMDEELFHEEFFRGLLSRDEELSKAEEGLFLECVRENLAPPLEPFLDAIRDRDSHWQRRYQAVFALRAVRSPAAVEALQVAVTDPERQVANLARETLQLLAQQELVTDIPPELLRPVEDVLVNGIDGTELIRIPAGVFIMGSDEEGESPQRKVHLDEYFIARYPVTNAQYRKFVEATGHEKALFWDDKDYNQPNQPVIAITWHDAVVYCQWAGLRLPTEAQWEKAARGTDGRTWPWGNEDPDDSRCNYDNNVGKPTDVGRYPEGASPYGCQDMAGNVYEWCQDWYGNYRADESRNPTGPDDGKGKVLRGGWYGSSSSRVRCAYRSGNHPGSRYRYFGFRGAR